ncbi:hypothetical protein C8Q74DRAFT_1219582 [Fomes fomentarius]|nr:hypothetical protein C8Q74DRAFT_1219582 [Fomes fomentarius]
MNIWNHTFTWTPDLVENGMVMRLFDSTGASATSSSFSVQAGDDTSCLKGKDTSVKTSDPSSTEPVPDTVRVGAALNDMSDEAVWGIFAAAACLFLGVVGLVLWLWLRWRERRRDVAHAAFDDDSWEPTTSRLSISWTLGQRLHAMGIPTIVVTSPTNASSIFSFAVDGPKGRSPKPPSVVLFDAAEAEVHVDGGASADSHTPLRREADDNEDAPLLGPQQTLSPPISRSKSPKLRALVI